MKNLFIILLFISVKASSQVEWRPTKETQKWKAKIFLRDSVTGKNLKPVDGYVVKVCQIKYINGISQGVRDWQRGLSVLDAASKKIPWAMFDHYEAYDPITGKLHAQ